MPLAGYADGDGRRWYDPDFHGMPSQAPAQSARAQASVEGTQQQGGGGQQPDDVDADAEGEEQAGELMDVDHQGGTQGGGSSGSNDNAEGEPDDDIMRVEAVPGEGAPVWRETRFRM